MPVVLRASGTTNTLRHSLHNTPNRKRNGVVVQNNLFNMCTYVTTKNAMPRSIGSAGTLYAKPKKGTLLAPGPTPSEPRRRRSGTHTARGRKGTRRARKSTFPMKYGPTPKGPRTWTTVSTDQTTSDSTVPKKMTNRKMAHLAKTIQSVFRQHRS